MDRCEACVSFADSPEKLKIYLQPLASVSSHFTVMKTVVDWLVKKTLQYEITSYTTTFIHDYLHALEMISDGCSFSEHILLHCCLPLVKLCVRSAINGNFEKECCTGGDAGEPVVLDCVSMPVIKAVGTILQNCCQRLEPSKSTDSFVQTMEKLFLSGDVSVLDIPAEERCVAFTPFEAKISLLQTRLVCFITSTLSCMDQSIAIPEVDSFMKKLLHLATTTS